MTLTRGQVVEALADAGIRPSRALGQNFVADPNTVRRIARLAGVGPGDAVVEVGAGLGSLTLALAETGARVTAIELDRRLLPLLSARVAAAGVAAAGVVAGGVVAGGPVGSAGGGPPGAVEVVAGDAMTLDWAGLLGAGPAEGPGAGRDVGTAPGTWTLVANLPYNIATPLVADLLDGVPAITRMVVMVQREVAERLAAGPGDAAYGAVSVKVAYWATARLLGAVPASVFVPRPNVESALVGIERRPRPAVDPVAVPAERLFELVRAGFAQRRKTLRRALGDRVDPGAWVLAGVDPGARAEQLGVGDWGRLAAATLSGVGAAG